MTFACPVSCPPVLTALGQGKGDRQDAQETLARPAHLNEFTPNSAYVRTKAKAMLAKQQGDKRRFIPAARSDILGG